MSPDRVIIPRSPPAARHWGFTMVELLVVIAIIGILAAIAIPNFSAYRAGREIKDQTSAFVRSVNLARSEAMKRGRPVSICRSDLPDAAAPACAANNGNWATGWVVFVDNDADSVIDVGEDIIRVQTGWASGGQITTNNAANNLMFRPNGIGRALGQTFTFKPKVEGSTKPVRLTLSFTGRWRQE